MASSKRHYSANLTPASDSMSVFGACNFDLQ